MLTTASVAHQIADNLQVDGWQVLVLVPRWHIACDTNMSHVIHGSEHIGAVLYAI